MGLKIQTKNTKEVTVYFKQTVHQIQPDQEYGGLFTFGGKVFSYTLLFRVPLSKMDEEIEKRQGGGQDVSSIDVKRDLFILVLKDQNDKRIDLSDDETYNVLATMACTMAVDVGNSSLTEGFNELFGGALEESFIDHEQESEVDEQGLPEFLRRLIQ